MAETRTSTLKAIDQFIKALENRIDVKKVILYGSHAADRPQRWSDIDIAVISNDFAGMDKKERLRTLSRITWDHKLTEIDVLGYTEAEFAVEDPLDLVSEIKEYGITVYEKE